MKTVFNLLIIIYILFSHNVHAYSQDCEIYKGIEVKTEFTDRIYDVIYKGMGKYPYAKIIPELGYLPNTSVSIALGKCEYYLPIVNKPKVILLLSTVNYGGQIKIKIRFFRNKRNRLLHPVVIIQDIIR